MEYRTREREHYVDGGVCQYCGRTFDDLLPRVLMGESITESPRDTFEPVTPERRKELQRRKQARLKRRAEQHEKELAEFTARLKAGDNP
jgi:hypothetical protein